MTDFDPNHATVARGDILEDTEILADPPEGAEEPEPWALSGEQPEAEERESDQAARYLRVSGRYQSCNDPWRLTLRVDVDRFRPKRMISGDYFRRSGATQTYFGSFRVDNLSISASSTMLRIVGTAKTTWSTSYNKIWIYLPRHTAGQPQATARVYWTTASNRRGAMYVCPFESPWFRTVVLEQDHENAVKPFATYDTGELPSGGPRRVLSVARAYGEAGIEMVDSRRTNEVPVAPGSTWSNAELHTAMENHFASWRDLRQWRVWYFHANRHDMGAGLLGIMFDQKGPQRQGCASFYTGVGGDAAAKRRDQLYVGVHELGHCFNLFHSFHKKYMKPPLPNRPTSLSWMNYPWRYPGGPGAFWSAFPFQFDHLETVHLRHAFYDDVVFGGNPFGKGAAIDSPEDFALAGTGDPGLALELRAPKPALAYGEPPVVEIRLSARSLDGRWGHEDAHLHPNFGNVQLAIEQPGGELIALEVPIQHCAEPELVWLGEDRAWSSTTAYIGLDKSRGVLFGSPGSYRIHGLYAAPDGSLVPAAPLTLRVAAPTSEEDQRVGDLMLGDEQAMLLYLLGSDSSHLQDGNDALQTVLEDHADHPLATYARLVKGVNAARTFKEIDADGELEVRPADNDGAEELLSKAVEESRDEADEGLDDITLLMAMDTLETVQAARGDDDGAAATLDRMVDLTEHRDVSAHVRETVRRRAHADG